MVTMQDVADRAQVSIATVSFVVNGTKRVTTSTRERVESAMRELGFARNPIGAALARGRTRIVAMLFPALERPLSLTAAAFFTSASRRARERGYDLVMWPIGNDAEQIAVLARSGLVDGVLLMEVQLDDPRVAALVEHDVEFAMIGRTADPSALPYVDIDMSSSVDAAYAQLTAEGHEDIAFLHSASPSYDHALVSRATRAYRELTERHGHPTTFISCEETPGDGRRVGERFAVDHPDTTAVIILNEHAAPGLVAGLARGGLDVPRDVSIISLGSSAYMAEMTDPPLTYLRTPGTELGELGLDALIDRVENARTPRPQILLPCELVPGGTVAAAAPVRHPHGPYVRTSPRV